MKYQRKLLAGITGYVPGEQPEIPGVIKLNTNENPYPPSPQVLEALRNLDTEHIRRYPDPACSRLRRAWAERFNLPGPEWVIVGNGMDDLLSLAVRAFVDPGDAVAATYPTYSLYEVLCGLHGARMEYHDLDERFGMPESLLSSRARLCFLTRPNAPTGVSATREETAQLCERFPGIVVIDEAYVDFADDHCMDYAARYENALVMRTFSKSFSLAGMRVGVAAGHPDLIAEMMKVKDSYNVNAFSQVAALVALEDWEYMRACAERVRISRDRLREQLTGLGFSVPRSQTNFLLAVWDGRPPARELFEALRERNIFVRYFPVRRLENALRITVGDDSQCDALVAALRDLLCK